MGFIVINWFGFYFRKKTRRSGMSRVWMYPEGELPFVTIQLPIFNEQFVVDRLIDSC